MRLPELTIEAIESRARAKSATTVGIAE